MSNSTDEAAGCFMLIVTVAVKLTAWLGSGVIAWEWVEPDNFSSALLFMLSWSILGAIFDGISILVMGVLAQLIE